MWGGATLTSDKNMSAGLSRQQLEKFEKDGILIIEDFLTKDEVCSIRNVFKHDEQNKLIFCTTMQWLGNVCPCTWGSCRAQRQKWNIWDCGEPRPSDWPRSLLHHGLSAGGAESPHYNSARTDLSLVCSSVSSLPHIYWQGPGLELGPGPGPGLGPGPGQLRELRAGLVISKLSGLFLL